MILKLTCGNNNIIPDLVLFAERIQMGDIPMPLEPGRQDYENNYKNRKLLLKFAREPFDKLTDENKSKLTTVISQAWSDFIKSATEDPTAFGPWIESFRAVIVPCIPDEWANGEDVYLCPTAYRHHNIINL